MILADYMKAATKALSSLLEEPIKVVHIEGTDVKDNPDGMLFRALNADNRVVASFRLSQLPGCCGVLVSHEAHVAFNYQRRGVGKYLAGLRLELAKFFGYSILLCTDVTANVPQRKILAKLGWKDVHKFVNARTKNEVAISLYNVY